MFQAEVRATFSLLPPLLLPLLPFHLLPFIPAPQADTSGCTFLPSFGHSASLIMISFLLKWTEPTTGISS